MINVRVAATAALLLVVACNDLPGVGSGPASPVIEIASEFPLRGDGSAPELDRAVDIAISEHPMVHGYRLVHVALDDSLAGSWNLERAVQNMRRAVRESAIAGVVGPLASFQAGFLIPMSSDSRLVVLSPSNTAVCVTDHSALCLSAPVPPDRPTNYFRIAARDTLIARAAADLAVHKLGISRFAVLTDPYAPLFSQQMADAFSEEVVSSGGQIVFSQPVFTLETNFAPLLRNVRAAGAQSIFLSAASGSPCTIRSQMQGIFPADAYLISGDRLAGSGCIQAANLTGQTDDHFVLAIATGEPRSIPADLQGLARGNTYPTYTFAAYDCARILIDAIDRAIRAAGGKAPTRDQVRAAVAATANFKGITGTYSFDANGDVVSPGFSFYTIQKGDWAFWRNP